MKRTLLIIEDNIKLAKIIFGSIHSSITDLFGGVFIANDGISAMKIIESVNPSIILLDLNIPKLTGLELLDKIKDKDTVIIIISGEIPMINSVKINSNKNIKKIYVKPFPIFNLISDIKYICSESEMLSIREKVKTHLNIFSFNKSSIGYLYLVECLIYIYYNPNFLNNMENNLFPLIMKKYKVKNTLNIKWSMQKTIKSMLRFTPTEKIEYFFHNNKVPTLKLFITTLSHFIKNS